MVLSSSWFPLLSLNHSEKQIHSQKVETAIISFQCPVVVACIETAVGVRMSEIGFCAEVKEMKELKVPNEEILKMTVNAAEVFGEACCRRGVTVTDFR